MNSFMPVTKTRTEMISKPKIKVPMMMTQVLMVEPVPINVNEISDEPSLKSMPFMATVTTTFSRLISEGSIWMLGVRHRIVVLLMYVATDEPKRPNLHLMP